VLWFFVVWDSLGNRWDSLILCRLLSQLESCVWYRWRASSTITMQDWSTQLRFLLYPIIFTSTTWYIPLWTYRMAMTTNLLFVFISYFNLNYINLNYIVILGFWGHTIYYYIISTKRFLSVKIYISLPVLLVRLSLLLYCYILYPYKLNCTGSLFYCTCLSNIEWHCILTCAFLQLSLMTVDTMSAVARVQSLWKC